MRAEEPELAGSMMRMEPNPGWSRRRHDLVLLLCAASALLCLAVGASGAGTVALLFGVAVAAVRRWRFSPPRRWFRSPSR